MANFCEKRFENLMKTTEKNTNIFPHKIIFIDDTTL